MTEAWTPGPGDRRLRVLLLNYEFPPLGGGASKATYHTAIELARLGHAVDVLTARADYQKPEEIIAGVRVIRVLSWRRGIHECGLLGAFSFVCFALFRLRRLLRDNRYDVLHYYFSLPTGLLSLYSYGVHKIPYIVSLRGSDVPGYDNSKRVLRLLHWFLKPLTRYIWKYSRSVVALSRDFRALALRTFADQPIDVIYNGVDASLFSPCNTAKDGCTIQLLCVTRLIERKGLEYLLTAIARLKDLPLCLKIVGSGERERALRLLAQEMGVDDRVQFIGYVPHQELHTIYNQSDIFVLPTLAESFGMVFVEAMGCGLPVIASKVGGVPEIVTDGENGVLVPPADVARLVDAIRRLARDPVLRQKMRGNNIAKVRAQFTWPQVALAYQALYRQCARPGFLHAETTVQ